VMLNMSLSQPHIARIHWLCSSSSCVQHCQALPEFVTITEITSRQETGCSNAEILFNGLLKVHHQQQHTSTEGFMC